MTHLTEEQRHGLVDGSLEAGPLAAATAHLRACAECSADVDRIRRLMTRVDDSKPAGPQEEIDELWPAIRARIDEKKVVVMRGREGGIGGRESARAGGREGRQRLLVAIGSVIAAGLIGFWALNTRVAPDGTTNVVEVSDSGISLVALVDSANAYQEEAQALLNRLEVQRATLRPEIARVFERDLRVIDVAIAELQGAIKSDPANPALRRLLASSYRQKVDLLKRVSNAG